MKKTAERTCKRCSAPLGNQAYKCPGCGQLNPTPAFWIAFALITPLAVLLGIGIIVAGT